MTTPIVMDVRAFLPEDRLAILTGLVLGGAPVRIACAVDEMGDSGLPPDVIKASAKALEIPHGPVVRAVFLEYQPEWPMYPERDGYTLTASMSFHGRTVAVSVPGRALLFVVLLRSFDGGEAQAQAQAPEVAADPLPGNVVQFGSMEGRTRPRR